MLNYLYNYIYFQPPFTPSDWDEYLSGPLKIFKSGEDWYSSKPAWRVINMMTDEVEGYYDSVNDLHVWIKDQ